MTITPLLIALIATPITEGSSEPVMLDFSASWCGPCQQMRPAIEQLIRKGYPIRAIDIDRSPKLAERYDVNSVPTFIVVDPKGKVLARTEGYQPAAELAAFYQGARAKAVAVIARRNQTDRDDDRDPGQDDDDRPRAPATNPYPWETVVRIKVHGNGAIGFGSGTIISSTPEESIILTCAHIFKLEGRRQALPSKFPRPIEIDLFDGKLNGLQPPQVHFVETVAGEAIDYDFSLDVGLIRIRPGRRLPASRVVPASWTPQSGMKMTTVGCSEGHDATAWSTAIVHPTIRGLSSSPSYEAIECATAPKQGRSGGGLYTIDGYVAGVCDFAEPRGNHGLYATPRSIRAMLDRNRLAALYAPAKGRNGRLLAETRPAAPKRNSPPSIARAQSPDADDPGAVTIPPPEMLGIKPPPVTRTASRNGSAGWRRPARTQPAPADDAGSTKLTDLSLPPEADNNRFQPLPTPHSSDEDDSAPLISSRSRSKWRAVKVAPSELASDAR